MTTKYLYLQGDHVSTAKAIQVSESLDIESFQRLVAAHFAIVKPEGISFHYEQDEITTVPNIIQAPDPIAIRIAGKAVSDVPGPPGLPYVGNYWEIYPDHLGNHQRLFEVFGPVFKTSTFGRTLYHTNDPEIASILFAESDFFTKLIHRGHPLYGLKNNNAGILVGDTETEAWRIAHKFFPPALGPKAVKHYAPVMEDIVDQSFKVFDELDNRGQAWNVYQYMLKMATETIAKLALGMDMNHFSSVDAKLHDLPMVLTHLVDLNKKVTSVGDWYAMLPFGNPQKLRQTRTQLDNMIIEAIERARSGGVDDLELQSAALEAANMVDYAVRATDQKGAKLPQETLVQGLISVVAAGFVTTSSLLSWLIYSLVSYPGVQDRLLQELIDHDINTDTSITPDLVNRLPFLDHFVKESQRRHSTAFHPARTAKVDLILPTGHRLSKNSVIIAELQHIHNNPKIWSNPLHFDPERWDTESVKNRHKGAYIPFGIGPRGCIGFSLASQEARLVISKLVLRYSFHREGDGVVHYDPLYQVIIPTNLYVRAKQRSTWPKKGGSVKSA